MQPELSRRAHPAQTAIVFLLVSTLLSACGKGSDDQADIPPPEAARVDIARAGDGFDVRIVHRTDELARWSADAVDRALVDRVASVVANASSDPAGVIFCPAPDIPTDDVNEAARALPEDLDSVTCSPDRANCPQTCPD